MFLHLCYYRKNKPLVLYEGFRTPSVHRGRSLALMYRYECSSKRKRSRMENQRLIFLKSKSVKLAVDFSPKCDMIQLDGPNMAEMEVTESWNFRQY